MVLYKNSHILILLFLIICSFQKAHAQALIPCTFVCATTEITGDVTLEWIPSTESCGPFVEYIIYASMDGGTYTALDFIFTEATTTYTHVGADGTIHEWCYYIEALYTCAGYTITKSDTLCNGDPVAPEIDYVTVQVGGVDIYWKPSTSSKTNAYKIYRDIGGFTEIATVLGIGTIHYFDAGANPSEVSENYTLASMDYCGNIGPYNEEPQHTILLSLDWVPCSYEVTLNWNAYSNWDAGITEYQIWASIDGAPAAPIGTASSTSTSFIYGPLIDDAEYMFTVRAIRADGTAVSVSNQFGLSAAISNGAAFSIMKQVTVEDGFVHVEWYNDIAADITNYSVLRGNDNITYSNINTTYTATAPTLSGYNDYEANYSSQSYYYKIETQDKCNNTINSVSARTIFLSDIANDNLINTLSWNVYDMAGAEVLSYEVFRDIGSGFVSIASLSASALQYDDNISDIANEASSACYYILANYEFTSPILSLTEQMISKSNKICIDQPSKIFIPNAIVPGSVNGIFKPYISFAENNSYRMQIFNRYGEIIFETTDIEQGWDGTYQNKIVQMGSYGYVITFIGLDGEEVKKKGNVSVIR